MKPFPNILFTLALASIGYGCWLVHPAAMYIVCGVIVAGIAFYGYVRK